MGTGVGCSGYNNVNNSGHGLAVAQDMARIINNSQATRIVRLASVGDAYRYQQRSDMIYMRGELAYAV